ELPRGRSFNLYGRPALGAVIVFIPREPGSTAANLEFAYGNQNSPNLSFWAGTKTGPWTVDASADLSQTMATFWSPVRIVVLLICRPIPGTPAQSQALAAVSATEIYSFAVVFFASRETMEHPFRPMARAWRKGRLYSTSVSESTTRSPCVCMAMRNTTTRIVLRLRPIE